MDERQRGHCRDLWNNPRKRGWSSTELLVFHRDRRDEAPLQGAARVTKSQIIPEEVARGKDGAAPIEDHPAPKIPFPVLGRLVLAALRQWKLRRFMIQGLHMLGMMILLGFHRE